MFSSLFLWFGSTVALFFNDKGSLEEKISELEECEKVYEHALVDSAFRKALKRGDNALDLISFEGRDPWIERAVDRDKGKRYVTVATLLNRYEEFVF